MAKKIEIFEVSDSGPNEVIFKIPNNTHQIQIGFKNHRDDCFKSKFYFYHKEKDLWICIDFQKAQGESNA
jgi:hypothetical protein